MKKIISSLLLVCLTLTIIKAQNEPVNPFAEFGYTPRIATLSKGKYVEFHDQDSIVQISYALFNTNTMKLVGFVKRDTSYSEATLEPEVISRWLSPDPLSAEFPSWSPYNYVENNPIRLVDPTGLAPEDPTIFADEGGNVLVDIKDGSDEVFIIKDEKRTDFAKEISTKIITDFASLKDPKLNAKIGEKFGFNLDNAVEEFGLGAFADNTLNSIDFRIGFDTGHDPSLSKGINGSLGLGKGGGGFTGGLGFGRKFRKEGKLNPFEPKIKGTALIQIKF